MNNRRIIVIGIVAAALSVFILLLAVVIIAPKVVDSKPVKDKLRSQIKETAGAEIDFQHLVLKFFPHPHIIFEQVVLSIPSAVKGKAHLLRVQSKPAGGPAGDPGPDLRAHSPCWWYSGSSEYHTAQRQRHSGQNSY